MKLGFECSLDKCAKSLENVFVSIIVPEYSSVRDKALLIGAAFLVVSLIYVINQVKFISLILKLFTCTKIKLSEFKVKKNRG